MARFWAAALDGYAVALYDDAELERLRSAGVDDPEHDPTVLVEPSGTGLRLWFQRVSEVKVVKNRVHLDLECECDVDVEVARLLALGAELSPRQANESLVVLLDPEGNEFCLLR